MTTQCPACRAHTAPPDTAAADHYDDLDVCQHCADQMNNEDLDRLAAALGIDR